MSRTFDPKTARQEANPSLWTVFLVFLRFSSPLLALIFTTIAVSARVALGGFTAWDLVIPLGLVAAQPFTEWLIHVFILHFRPRKVLGRTLDLQVARLHREHHREPWKLELIFIPKRAGLIGLVIAALGWYAATPTVELFLTGLASTLAMALVYEWTHYLTHTNYRPRGALYRRVWRFHRLHHFKNERYWMGVTMHLGDRVLGTQPDPAKVEASPTCRTLGVTG
mgnify:CR=1 FL=1